MIGSIIGDIVGSRFEFDNISSKKFDLFNDDCFYTDDTVLTIATSYHIHRGFQSDGVDFSSSYLKFYQRHNEPFRSWGAKFNSVAKTGKLYPYNSFGNGAAMRVSPIYHYCGSYERSMVVAEESAKCTHNHPEGIKGAKAIVSAIYFANQKMSKDFILGKIRGMGYKIHKDLGKYENGFFETCQETVPRCMSIFYNSNSFEDAIRTAVSYGGDVDTNACIVGGIAECYYDDIDPWLVKKSLSYLSDDLKCEVLLYMHYCTSHEFQNKYIPKEENEWLKYYLMEEYKS